MYQLFTNVDWSNISEKNTFESVAIKFDYLQECFVDSRCISNLSVWVRIGIHQSHFMNFLELIFAMTFYLFFSIKIPVGPKESTETDLSWPLISSQLKAL